MRYLPHTPSEIRQMLDAIGVGSVDELFESVPKDARFSGQLAVPTALSEPELMSVMTELASENSGARMLSFLGAGIYDHHVPPAVDQLLQRSEFYTAYTPYQPEVAQGTLQAIWEFQTIVSELYGLPLANASMYDGATSAAEAVQMARRLTRRNRVLLSGCVHPQYREVIRTFLSGQSQAELVEVPAAVDGNCDIGALSAHLDERTAAVVVGYPSFRGTLCDLSQLAQAVHGSGGLLISSTTEPYALAVVKSPGECGVDIATGEGQALACPPSFGGPGVGLFACRSDRKYLQQLPGRICGETVDESGKRGYVLTLSTREQHIRRERATSNICTNQGLLALSMTIRVSMLGKTGFVQTAKHCLAKAHYLKTRLNQLDGCSVPSQAPVFNEFVVHCERHSARHVVAEAKKHGVIPGYDLGQARQDWADSILVAVTEKHTRAQLDRLCDVLAVAAG